MTMLSESNKKVLNKILKDNGYGDLPGAIAWSAVVEMLIKIIRKKDRELKRHDRAN